MNVSILGIKLPLSLFSVNLVILFYYEGVYVISPHNSPEDAPAETCRIGALSNQR